jgi:hypothetical protein
LHPVLSFALVALAGEAKQELKGVPLFALRGFFDRFFLDVVLRKIGQCLSSGFASRMAKGIVRSIAGPSRRGSIRGQAAKMEL